MTFAKGGLNKQTTADNLVVYEAINCDDPHVEWLVDRMRDEQHWEVVRTAVQLHKHYTSQIPRSVDELLGVFPTENDAMHYASMLAEDEENVALWVRNNRHTSLTLVEKLTGEVAKHRLSG